MGFNSGLPIISFGVFNGVAEFPTDCNEIVMAARSERIGYFAHHGAMFETMP